MELDQVATTLRRAIRPADLCPVAEAAVRAHLNAFTVWRWIREGRIKAYGRPGCLRVSLADLLPEYDPQGRQGQ
jgi:hypothetical protein